MKAFVLTIALLLSVPELGTSSRVAFAQNEDARDVKARELFTVGKYQDAIDLYGKLYAETLHPTYLRNVGRCYQMLGKADQAISSFRDHLRRSKNLSPEKRAEVDGFIREMESLKQKQTATKKPEEIPLLPVAGVKPPVLPTPSVDHAPRNDELGLSTTRAAPPAADTGPANTKWWLWGGAGVVFVGATVAAILLLHGGGQATRQPI